MPEEWRAKPASEKLVALAFGGAARIAVRFGLSAARAAELMRRAWHIVQDKEIPSEASE